MTDFDLNGGAIAPGDQNSEAVFVPTGSDEGQGLLLACCYRARTDTTDVVILDADDPGAPPVATIALPKRIPAGFHGTWIPS